MHQSSNSKTAQYKGSHAVPCRVVAPPGTASCTHRSPNALFLQSPWAPLGTCLEREEAARPPSGSAPAPGLHSYQLSEMQLRAASSQTPRSLRKAHPRHLPPLAGPVSGHTSSSRARLRTSSQSNTYFPLWSLLFTCLSPLAAWGSQGSSDKNSALRPRGPCQHENSHCVCLFMTVYSKLCVIWFHHADENIKNIRALFHLRMASVSKDLTPHASSSPLEINDQ